MSFFLFFVHSDLKDLLLAEIKLKHPTLRLSFSNREIISMKGYSGYELELKARPLAFAKRMALFLNKSNSKSDYSVEVRAEEFWHYAIIETPCDTFDLEEVEKPQAAPSRAWHKIQEAYDQFSWNFKKGEAVIEVGSAPGGISYFLINKGAKLTAIDPADMAEDIGNFTHIKESVFDIRRNQLPNHCDWIVSDLNLSGDLNISQCKRIADFYPRLKGGFITIKTPNVDDLGSLEKWQQTFSDFNTTMIHLPSHRRELGLFFTKVSSC